MTEDNLLPKTFYRAHPKDGTPWISIVILAALKLFSLPAYLVGGVLALLSDPMVCATCKRRSAARRPNRLYL